MQRFSIYPLCMSIVLFSCVSTAPDVANNSTNNTHNNNANNINNTSSTTTTNNTNNTNLTNNTNNNTNNITETSCVSAVGEAVNVKLPVDVIWVVDNSQSMDWEAETVESGMNEFAALIALTGLDYHVVLLSNDTICIPPPLAGPDCTDATRFRHINVTIDSENALQVIVDYWPVYSPFLRENARTSFVVVSDDNSIRSAEWFSDHVNFFSDPEISSDWLFHSVVAQGSLPFIGCCSANGCGAAIGDVYMDLSSQTGGISSSICQENWTPLFSAIAQSSTTGTILPCAYEIPTPGQGETIDFNEINVQFTPSGDSTPITIPMVLTELYCEGSDGWFYDDPADPHWVILCDDTCAVTQEGHLEVVFGCDTIVQ